MRDYVIRRLLLIIPTLLIVTFTTFIIQRLVPGNIIDAMVLQAGHADLRIQAIDRDIITHRLGMDEPILVQYGRWLGVVPQDDGSFSGIFQGNLGLSLWKQTPILDDMTTRMPVTIELGLMALIIGQLIALPIGIFSAVRQDTWGDYIGRTLAIVSIAVPGFWIATLVIVFPAIWWGYMPSIEYISFGQDPIGNLKMFIIPALILGVGLSGLTMRMTRTMMLEVLRQDYIRTAWAKGLRERVVVTRHALRNALIPVVTIIGAQIPILIGGAVIIEQIFCLPGMGRLLLDATVNRDYPVVSGVFFVIAAAVMLINIGVDITYSLLDPRVHYK